MDFKLHSPFQPTGDQPQAITSLTNNLNQGIKDQVLLGVTGSGKTFTMANVIQNIQRPTLVISHNKTLAAQLAQEFKEFFPKNAVEYFVSYYDYYQPEAYIPQSDTYIDKESNVNELIEKLRLSTTASLLTRKDVIVVASVSCIYNIGSPIEFARQILTLKIGKYYPLKKMISQLISLYYERNDFDFHRATFRIRGNALDLYPSWEDQPVRIEINENGIIKQIFAFDKITGKRILDYPIFKVFSARHYLTPTASDSTDKIDDNRERVLQQIERDLDKEVKRFMKLGQPLEAERLKQRVNYDLEMMRELGYCNGIENYSRYFDGRKIGEPPYTLLDYFRLFDNNSLPEGAIGQSRLHNHNKTMKPACAGRQFNNWLLIIDESHMTIPQIGGMYEGDRSRKRTLVDFGFRLKAAIDNRPLKFTEFEQRMPQTVYVSATPGVWETKRATTCKSQSKNNVGNANLRSFPSIVEQLIRPTGLLEPKVSVRPTKGQIPDLLQEIAIRIQKGQRVLITTLTKRMAEDLSEYIKNQNVENENFRSLPKNHQQPIRCMYLHSDIDTLERTDILEDLRKGKYDVLVGINLLREGLDLPEVSLVVILDADKESFLRSETSLIQTMGRAARHEESSVIMYADQMTQSMKKAINEVNRRRQIQARYNLEHGITPKSIEKTIRPKLIDTELELDREITNSRHRTQKYQGIDFADLEEIEANWPQLLPDQKIKSLTKLKRQMRQAAKELDFEVAATIRDVVRKLEK